MKNGSILMLVLVLVAGALVSPALGAGAPETIRGKLEIVHGDDFDGDSQRRHTDGVDAPLPNLEHWLRSGSALTRLEFPGSAPSLAYGTNLTVTGQRRNGRFAVSSYRVEAVAGGSKTSGGGGSTSSYLGGRDTLVVLMRFAAADPTLLKSRETLREEIFTGPTSSSEYFRETSFGKAWLKGKNDGSTGELDGGTGDITEWNTITADTSACNYSAWAAAGKAAAEADGWNFTGYKHIVNVFPYTTVCGWSGLGQIGGTNTWINGATAGGRSSSYVVSHEIGHNITLAHARSYECTANGVRVSIAPTCEVMEYGDHYEVMGRGYYHLNGRSKPHLGWMPTTNMKTVTSGIHTIYPIETSTSGLQTLRVSRSRNKDFLWIEARSKATAFDSSYTFESGALIHTGADIGSYSSTYVVDGDPHTDTQNDAVFEEGEAFVDTVKGIYVEVQKVDAATGAVTVLVKTGYTNSVPTASAGPAGSSTVGVPHTHEGATAGDVDRNLMKYQWSWTSCPSACPALSGAAGPVSGAGGSIPGPTYTPDETGNYTLTLTVWDATGAKVTSSVTDSASAAPAI